MVKWPEAFALWHLNISLLSQEEEMNKIQRFSLHVFVWWVASMLIPFGFVYTG